MTDVQGAIVCGLLAFIGVQALAIQLHLEKIANELKRRREDP